MEVKINFNIDSSLTSDDIIIHITAAKNSGQLQKLLDDIQKLSKTKSSLIGFKNNEIYILPVQDITLFYSHDKKCYCQAHNDVYVIKKKLYELEEILDKNQFIRISNSHIINISFIKNFDLNYTGNILIKLLNGDTLNVSKRRISSILKFLKER